MRQVDLEKVLAASNLTLDILLLNVPPKLVDLDGDKVLLVEEGKYFKASSYLEVEKACEHAGADLKDGSLKVFAMPYMSLSCCRSLEDLMIEDGGKCFGVTIDIVNFEFVQRQAKILGTHFNPLLEDSLGFCEELGQFLARSPFPSKDAIECLLRAKADAQQRLLKANDQHDELNAAIERGRVLRLEIDLKLETALYNAQEKYINTLQRATSTIELLNDELNSLCVEYNVLGDVGKFFSKPSFFLMALNALTEKESCDLGKDHQSSCVQLLDTQAENILCDVVKCDLGEGNDTKNISDGSPKEEQSLKSRSRPSVDDLRRSLFPQLDNVPDRLMDTSDHLIIEVQGMLWTRVSDFNEFECLCEKGSSYLAKYILNVVVMPYMSLKGCSQLLNCYTGNSAKCHCMQFQIKNLEFTMKRAMLLDCDIKKLLTQNAEAIKKLLTQNAEAIGTFQKRLLGVSIFEVDENLKILLAGRDSAIEELISSMFNEGLDIHATLLKLKPEIHYQIYVEDGGFDPCEDPDMQIGLRCLESLSRIEAYKNDLAAPQIGSVDEQRTRLVDKQAKLASSQLLWQAKKNQADLLASCLDRFKVQNQELEDLCSKIIWISETGF